VLRLRAIGSPATTAKIAERLRPMPGARHVMRLADSDGALFEVTADLVDDAVDGALEEMRRLGVPHDDITLFRMDQIGPAAAVRPLATVVWADLISQAGVNARPLARYLAFMGCAGVIAVFGVIYANTTLIVGAMAISPDILPITAAATAIVLRRWRLARRALLALAIGLGFAALIGAAVTWLLNSVGALAARPLPGQAGFLAGLATVNVSTPIVAFAAGIAAILALETRASSAVGVAISVTTIPATAYFGAATGFGEPSKATGALEVLGINVAMLLVAGCATLVSQRWLARPRRPAAAPPVGGD
jgi:uncharacterized hydrophobic protein (TIGR00271 family)